MTIGQFNAFYSEHIRPTITEIQLEQLAAQISAIHTGDKETLARMAVACNYFHTQAPIFDEEDNGNNVVCPQPSR